MSLKEYNTIVVYNKGFTRGESSILEKFNIDLMEKLLEFLTLSDRVSLSVTKKTINSLISTFPYDTIPSGLIHKQLPTVKLSGLFVGFYKGLQPIRHDLSNLKRLSFTIIPRLIRRDINLFSNCSKLEELTLRVKFEPYRREYFPHSHNVKKLSLKDVETFYRIKRAIHRLSEKYMTLDLTSCKKLKKLTITNGSHGLDLLLNENNVIEEFDITSSGWDHSFLSKMNHLTHLSLSGLGVGDISDLTSLKSLYLGYVYTDSEIFKNSSMMPQNLTHLTVENGDWNPEVFSLSFINNCKNLHSLEITISRTTVDLTSLEIFPILRN